MQNSHAIANDNSPLSQHPLGDSIGFNAALREKNNQRTAIDDHFGEDWTEDPSDKAQTGFNIYRFFLLLWAAAIVSVMWFQFMDRALGGQIATFILLICSSLALHPAAKMVRRFRLSEFAIFTALAATLGLWLALSELYFFEISAADAAVGFSGIALIIAWLMKSDIALIISCCAALIWVTLHQSIGTANLIPMSILPLLIGMQLITASQHSSTIAIATACFAAYLWIYMMCFTHYAQNNISMLHVAGLVTLIGAAHHRIGKMLDDSKVGGAPLHAVLGWLVIMAGTFALQDFWFSPTDDIWQNLTANNSGVLAFRISAFLALAIAGMAVLLRGGLSVFSMLSLLALGLFVVVMSSTPDAITSSFAQLTGHDAAPEVGFILSGFILASAFVMVVNGIRRSLFLMVAAGICVFIAQIYVLTTSHQFSDASMLMLIASFILTLCLAVLMSATVLRSVLNPEESEEPTPAWPVPSRAMTPPRGTPPVNGAYFTRNP